MTSRVVNAFLHTEMTVLPMPQDSASLSLPSDLTFPYSLLARAGETSLNSFSLSRRLSILHQNLQRFWLRKYPSNFIKYSYILRRKVEPQDMGSKNITGLQTPGYANNARENKAKLNSSRENNACENESQNTCDDVIFAMEDLEQRKEEIKGNHTMTADLKEGPIVQQPIESDELVEPLSVSHVASIDQREELDFKVDASGKRHQEECTVKESSVRVLYSFLPSHSKRKLEELLHHWSEWHAKNCALVEDPVDSLETGEETYFPALHVGLDKPSTVSFSMDVHARKRQRKGSLMDNDCSPQYDRGYAVGLALDGDLSEERAVDLREAHRCFNCGSYNHPLSECSKPRDKNAVNSARKQYLTKKSQNVGPRVPTRYYQESPGGKFDGLKPGSLSTETRKLLGIGELDPPPWLNRMRELGYPPGYFDTEAEDQASGIAIYGDDDPDNATVKNDVSLDEQKSQKKKSVDFPGVNAPIPENADQWLWNAPTPRGPPIPNLSWNQVDNRGFLVRDSMRPNYHTLRPHLGFGSSPPVSHYSHHYHPSESFSPRGVPLPTSPSYGRQSNPGMPFLHFDYGSL